MKPVLVGDLGAGVHTIELPEVMIVSPGWLSTNFPNCEVTSMSSPPREYVRDAEGNVCEVRARTNTTQGPKVWVRTVGSSYERDLSAESVTPCDAEGAPLPAAEPA